jgi:hypothetical protein
MGVLDDIVSDANVRGLRPWLAIKEAVSRRAIEVVARTAGPAVLHGGAALHFAYGSPRLSVDVDFAGVGAPAALEAQGEVLARAAGEVLGCAASWSVTRAGRLLRGKVAMALHPARKLVLPVEAIDVPAHRPHLVPGLGLVEEPGEIVADKIVASADRVARRGVLKTRDLYDLWYVCERLGAQPPDAALVEVKLRDYGESRRGVDLAGAARAVPPYELRSALEGVLPADVLAGLDETAILRRAAELFEEYRDVV